MDTLAPGRHGSWSLAAQATVDHFDRWLRTEFVALNTELEQAYFSARRQIVSDRPGLEQLKQAILADGAALIDRIAADHALPPDELSRYQLLGSIGVYLAACRRHEVATPEHPDAGLRSAAWSLASRLGSALGVAPRFVFAHQSLYNPAVGDTYRTFTSLVDESIFTTYNGLAVLAYERAANALRRIPAMGVSSPLATYLFEDARAALDDVLRFNRELSDKLDVDRFFFNIRPYFKPYRVGRVEYRGANAGDFAAINEIDLALGLCEAHDPFYQDLLTEKYAYVPPDDQVLLRAAVTGESLLASFRCAAEAGPVTPQLRTNAELFLAVCRSHGAAYTYHHQKLVKPFLEEPAKTTAQDLLADLTASGPPLAVVVAGLSRLSDLRAARDRPGLRTARASLDRLRQLVATSGG